MFRLRAARARRESEALRYRPEKVKLLLVAEGPPRALERYFYFDDVQKQDDLFRWVYRGIAGKEPRREEKAEQLRELCDRGVFVVDVSEEPVGRGTDLAALAPDLIGRCRALDPEWIILIKTTVFDAFAGHLRRAGLPVSGVRIPFPTAGRQREFQERFALALKDVGL